MADLVVTVPRGIWHDWIAEGDAAGDPASGEEWGFYLSGPRPDIAPGERVYVVAHGRLRGYAVLTRLVQTESGWCLCRRGGAVAVTIAEPVKGFRSWRRRWWKRWQESEFPAWKTEGVGRG